MQILGYKPRICILLGIECGPVISIKLIKHDYEESIKVPGFRNYESLVKFTGMGYN
jgi:hypothetical protein